MILEFCQNQRAYGEINQNIVKGPKLLSDYLKHLQKIGYLAHDLDTRKYKTTEKGNQELLKRGVIAKASQEPSIPVLLYHFAEVPMREEKISIGLGNKVPFSSEPVAIRGFLCIDQAHLPKLDQIKKELEKERVFESLEGFFRDVGKAIGDVYGHRKIDARRIRDLVIQQKMQMDFDSVLLLHFSGREAAKKLDWRTLAKTAELRENELEKDLKQFKGTMKKNKEARTDYMKEIVRTELARCAQAIKREEPYDAATASSLNEQFMKRIYVRLVEIWKTLGLPKPKESELKQFFEELERMEVVKTVARYSFRIDEEKLLQI
jgi:hypothetical protein